MVRGQAEVLVIVGIIVVVVLATFYAFQTGLINPSPLPASIAAQQRVTKDTVLSLLREQSLRTLKTLSAQGGYASEPPNAVTFLNKPVPYWFVDGTVSIPDSRTTFQSTVQSALEDAIPALDEALDTVSFGQPVVSVSVHPARLDLSLSLPTTIAGYTITEPYTLSLPTHFGEILNFASDFVQTNPNQYNRSLEVFTAASIFISPIKNGIQSVPVFLQPACGEVLTVSSMDVLPEMEQLIRATLANTYQTGQSPNDNLRQSSYPEYEIPPLFGKTYDLDLSFHLPDDFALDYASFQMTPDPAVASFQFVPFAGTCVPDQKAIQYYVRYPAIVRVKDPDTGYLFQFAVQVTIKNNKPASIDSAGYLPDAQTQLCATPLCPMDLTVSDSSGAPVDDAQVVYLGCPLGRTDNAGRLQKTAPCGAGTLSIRKQGFAPSTASRNSQDIQSLPVVLRKMPRFTLQLWEAGVVESETSYTVTGLSALLPDKRTMLVFASRDTGEVYNFAPQTSALSISSLPPGRYIVTATLTSIPVPNTPLTVFGSLLFETEITETTQTLHLVLPRFSTQGDQTETAVTLGALFRLCSLSMSSVSPSAASCMKSKCAARQAAGLECLV